MKSSAETAVNQPHPFPKRYLTNDQFCGLMGRSHYTSQRWRTRGDGPPYLKIGNRIMYDLDDVQEWMACQKRENTGYGQAVSLVEEGEEDEEDEIRRFSGAQYGRYS